jgi:UDP-N-acetylmuramate--alanine ligase
MSGIAELLSNLGYRVSGSDAKASEVTRRLASLGVEVFEGHAAAQIGDADVVVVSSAVREDNAEVGAARTCGIPVIPRAEMLAELMRLRHGIAVAGTHGKTTTTSMIAVVLDRAGLDPTAVIGGRLSAFGSNARLGQGAYMVAEADESDGSFLRLAPVVSVITNIDREHLDHYGTFDRLLEAFVDFANKVPFYGAVVACADDPHVARIRPRITRRVVSYGIESADADLRASSVSLDASGVRASVSVQHTGRVSVEAGTLGELSLRVPGRHNLLNALAATAVGLELGLDFQRIASALGDFRGAERRFEVLGEAAGVLVVDDYGHHPTEIAAVIAAARPMERRIVLVFQPHRYTRTRDLLHQFAHTLAQADQLVLADIYAAGEEPLPGVTVDAVADAVRAEGSVPVRIVPAIADLPDAIAAVVRRGDLVITLGAGSIGSVGRRVLERLSDGSPQSAGRS